MQGFYNYLIITIILFTGLYGCFIANSFLKKTISLSIFQGAILLFFISLGKIANGKAPILECLDFSKCPENFASPLPHVLMLTAIVVGLATLAVALSLIIRIKNSYGSINETEVLNINLNEDLHRGEFK